MAKKILILMGSPKKNGNTATLSEWFAEGARAKGAKVETVYTAYLKYKSTGCTSCRACQRSKKYECVINDDARKVLIKMISADVIVMASPLYFYTVSAQLKLVMDRMFSLFKWDNTTNEFTTPLKGKTLVFLGTAYEDVGMDVFKAPFKITADYAGMKFKALLAANSGESGDIKKLKGMKEKAVAFGKKAAA